MPDWASTTGLANVSFTKVQCLTNDQCLKWSLQLLYSVLRPSFGVLGWQALILCCELVEFVPVVWIKLIYFQETLKPELIQGASEAFKLIEEFGKNKENKLWITGDNVSCATVLPFLIKHAFFLGVQLICSHFAMYNPGKGSGIFVVFVFFGCTCHSSALIDCWNQNQSKLQIHQLRKHWKSFHHINSYIQMNCEQICICQVKSLHGIVLSMVLLIVVLLMKWW